MQSGVPEWTRPEAKSLSVCVVEVDNLPGATVIGAQRSSLETRAWILKPLKVMWAYTCRHPYPLISRGKQFETENLDLLSISVVKPALLLGMSKT